MDYHAGLSDLDRRRRLTAYSRSEATRPVPETVWRWFDQAVAEGRVFHDGKGTRSSPYRYWNASLVKKWEADEFLRVMAEAEDEAVRFREEMGQPPV